MVPNSHYYPAILHRAGDSDVDGNGTDVGAERVVARRHEALWDPLEMTLNIVTHTTQFAVLSPAHLMGGEYDGWLRMAARTLSPSERVDQAREAHAHTLMTETLPTK